MTGLEPAISESTIQRVSQLHYKTSKNGVHNYVQLILFLGDSNMKHNPEQIKQLRQEGKTYQQIADILGTTKSAICYHLNDEQKTKTYERTKKLRAKMHPFQTKLEAFKIKKIYNKSNYYNNNTTNEKLLYCKIHKFHKTKDNKSMPLSFTVEDVITKFGENPKCYLTGKPIDIYKPRTYHFDHIVPRSKGGENTLDNLQICTKQANQAKHDLSCKEFIELCKQVVEFTQIKNYCDET